MAGGGIEGEMGTALLLVGCGAAPLLAFAPLLFFDAAFLLFDAPGCLREGAAWSIWGEGGAAWSIAGGGGGVVILVLENSKPELSVGIPYFFPLPGGAVASGRAAGRG